MSIVLQDPWGRSDVLIEALRREAARAPQRRIGWTRFIAIGAEMGLSMAVIGKTLGYCFDVFTLEMVRDGRVLPPEEVASVCARLARGRTRGQARETMVYYRLK